MIESIKRAVAKLDRERAVIQERVPLPFPLNLPKKEKLAALQSMTAAQRSEIAGKLSEEFRRRWLASLRSEYPRATEGEFRRIVIARLMKESRIEERIMRAGAARHGRSGSLT